MTNINSEVDDVRHRLFELISKLSYDDILKLVDELESRLNFKAQDRRKHARKSTKIETSITTRDATLSDTSLHDISFKEFMQNISNEGAYIKTAYPFRIHQELSLIFPLSGVKDPINITGTIERIDPEGVGVKFDEIISDV
ncbi:MAG: PilZ domain-containing protein [Desulfobacterales bacterium]|nr:MAG: PilZ domain-containing protein [Desulfobacterales bacterium]